MKMLKVNFPDALIEKIEIQTEQRILKELNLILHSFMDSKLMPYTQILDAQCKGFIAFCNTLGCSFKKDSIVCIDRKNWSKEDSVYKGIFSEEIGFILEGLASKEKPKRAGFYQNEIVSNPIQEGKWPGVPFDQPKPRLSVGLIDGPKGSIKPIIKDCTQMSEAVPPRPFRD